MFCVCLGLFLTQIMLNPAVEFQIQAEVQKMMIEKTQEVKQLYIYHSPCVVAVYYYSGFPLSHVAINSPIGQYASQHEQLLQIAHQSSTQVTRVQPNLAKTESPKQPPKKDYLKVIKVPTEKNKEKTVLCKFGQNCDFRSTCTFAHDLTELRQMIVKSNYKVTTCKNSKCSYGFRCNHLHANETIVQAYENCKCCFQVYVDDELVLKFLRLSEDRAIHCQCPQI